jgi:exopolysaccharide biosynthesis polyprenyl glycosylphosphotransferase
MTLGTLLGLDRPPGRKQDVLSGFMRRIGITDLLVISWAVVGAQLIRFGRDGAGAKLPVGAKTLPDLKYTAFSAALIVAWMLMLRLQRAYDRRLLGHGPEEYRAVAVASFRLFSIVAVASYVLRLELARGYVAIALPAGTIGLLLSRWLWRKWLTMHRAQGQMSGSVLVVGSYEHLVNLIRALDSVPAAGYRVVAACCSDADQPLIGRVPVVGDESEAAEIAGRIGVNTVACTSSWRLGTGGLRRLSWALEGQDVDLVVAPSLTDVAGPRVLTRPVAGLSLLHVEAPVFAGPKLALKTAMDRIGAAALLTLLSPLFAVVAFLVWRHDRGPVFFKHERIGKEGQVFRMFKFRTMVTNAESLLPSLLDTLGQEAAPLYKIRSDPRLTPAGSWLRRYSIDELPQLINVLRGEMSLVGPRPQVKFEVETYTDDVHRRLLVKPGMTGLWQINGRSDLSWDEAVRFDLYYVENWSLVSDLMILFRTARAVMQASGAY